MNKIVVVFLTMMVSIGAWAQESVMETFEKGLTAFQNKDYRLAIKYMNMVRKPSTDPHVRTQAQDVIAKCNEHLDKDSIKASKTGLTFNPDGDFKELNVWASGKWEIVSSPEWVSVENITDNYIKLWGRANNGTMQRTGNLSIRCGTETVTVSIFQDRVQEKSSRVLFKTIPNNAYVEIPGEWAGYSSSPVPLGKGEYIATVSKEGYKTVEVPVVVETLTDEARVMEVELEPLFGKIKPRVMSESGKEIQDVDFRIGVRHVDLSDLSNSLSFDDKGRVENYELYRDGTIPLSPQKYNLIVTAQGFAPEQKLVEVVAGETLDLDITLSSVTGKLLVRDRGRAAGATVLIKDINLEATVGDTLNVPVGRHQVEILKDNHLLDEGILDVTINKGELTVVDAEMTRMVDLLVSTQGSGETLYIDGQKVHSGKLIQRVPLTEGETYLMDIKKPGYWTFSKEIKVTPRDTLFDYRNMVLEEVHPFKLKIDEGGMKVEMKHIGFPEGEDYARGLVTGNTKGVEILDIPYGKYKIKLTDQSGKIKKRASRLVTYRGTVDFSAKKDKKIIQTWPTSSLATLKFLSIEYTLYPMAKNAPSTYMPVPVRANFLDFTLFKGLSTSLAEGAMVYTANMPMPGDMPKEHYTTIMPAISVPLTNYDFRIGGGLFPGGQISAFVSYSYDFEIDRIVGVVFDKLGKTYRGSFDHFGGHEVFGGIELSSRIRYFNFYIRAGVQYLKGARNYTYGYYTNNEDVDTWVDRLVQCPVDQTSFIITLGINLGGKQSKGQNVLMLF